MLVPQSQPVVSIIVLNWNRFRDTCDCLASLFALEYQRFQVIVCDNGSADGSLSEIRCWAQGAFRVDANATMQPLRWMQINRTALEQRAFDAQAFRIADLVIVDNLANVGFAAGNNVGLRAAMVNSAAEFFWVLNNDTVVDRGALGALVKTMRALPECGMCGSTLVGYEDPHRVQASGGSYNRWLGRTRHVGTGLDIAALVPKGAELSGNEYPVGASLLLSRALLQQVGLFCEDYFLYFEELDLLHRASGRFRAAQCSQSIVRHREAAATGAEAGGGSLVADYCFSRSRVLLTRKFHPGCLVTVVLSVVASATWRLVRGRTVNARAVFRGLWDGLLGRNAQSSGYPTVGDTGAGA
jgi:hypothetical protein